MCASENESYYQDRTIGKIMHAEKPHKQLRHCLIDVFYYLCKLANQLY